MSKVHSKKSNLFNARVLTASAACIALAVLFSFIPLFRMPYGGSVTFMRMLFIALPGFFFGPIVGFVAAISYGILNFIISPWFVHPVQLLLDYILGFGVLGISGFFRNTKNGLYAGFILGSFGRFVFSSLSAYIFYLEWAPPDLYGPNGMNVLFYPIIYNISYIGPEVFITVVIISIPVVYNVIERIKGIFLKV